MQSDESRSAEMEAELDSIGDLLVYGQANGNLEVEIIWSAMKYLQNNTAATIAEACQYGISEWDK